MTKINKIKELIFKYAEEDDREQRIKNLFKSDEPLDIAKTDIEREIDLEEAREKLDELQSRKPQKTPAPERKLKTEKTLFVPEKQERPETIEDIVKSKQYEIPQEDLTELENLEKKTDFGGISPELLEKIKDPEKVFLMLRKIYQEEKTRIRKNKELLSRLIERVREYKAFPYEKLTEKDKEDIDKLIKKIDKIPKKEDISQNDVFRIFQKKFGELLSEEELFEIWNKKLTEHLKVDKNKLKELFNMAIAILQRNSEIDLDIDSQELDNLKQELKKGKKIRESFNTGVASLRKKLEKGIIPQEIFDAKVENLERRLKNETMTQEIFDAKVKELKDEKSLKEFLNYSDVKNNSVVRKVWDMAKKEFDKGLDIKDITPESIQKEIKPQDVEVSKYMESNPQYIQCPNCKKKTPAYDRFGGQIKEKATCPECERIYKRLMNIKEKLSKISDGELKIDNEDLITYYNREYSSLDRDILRTILKSKGQVKITNEEKIIKEEPSIRERVENALMLRYNVQRDKDGDVMKDAHGLPIPLKKDKYYTTIDLAQKLRWTPMLLLNRLEENGFDPIPIASSSRSLPKEKEDEFNNKVKELQDLIETKEEGNEKERLKSQLSKLLSKEGGNFLYNIWNIETIKPIIAEREKEVQTLIKPLERVKKVGQDFLKVRGQVGESMRLIKEYDNKLKELTRSLGEKNAKNFSKLLKLRKITDPEELKSEEDRVGGKKLQLENIYGKMLDNYSQKVSEYKKNKKTLYGLLEELEPKLEEARDAFVQASAEIGQTWKDEKGDIVAEPTNILKKIDEILLNRNAL